MEVKLFKETSWMEVNCSQWIRTPNLKQTSQKETTKQQLLTDWAKDPENIYITLKEPIEMKCTASL